MELTTPWPSKSQTDSWPWASALWGPLGASIWLLLLRGWWRESVERIQEKRGSDI